MILLQGAVKTTQEEGAGFGRLPGSAPGGGSIVAVSAKVTSGVAMANASQRCVSSGPESGIEPFGTGLWRPYSD